MSDDPTFEEDELPPHIVPFCAKQPEIIFQDKHVLVVNKPEFLLTVPGRHRLNKDCLITRLQENFGFEEAKIVHRLDLDTSGLVIIPLGKPAQSHISRQFQQRTVSKTYIAELWGTPDTEQGAIDLPIKPDWFNRPLQIISWEGKHAETFFKIIERHDDGHCRVKLKPHTGRSHQLRIHTAWIGHPIRGCDMYAHKEAFESADRLMLHASEITFLHPVTETEITVCCDPNF